MYQNTKNTPWLNYFMAEEIVVTFNTLLIPKNIFSGKCCR